MIEWLIVFAIWILLNALYAVLATPARRKETSEVKKRA